MPDPNRPHAYKPRTLTGANLRPGWGHDWLEWAVKDPANRPCAICGGSRTGLVIHDLPYRPISTDKALAAIQAADRGN